MTWFFSLFTDSYKEFKNLSTITFTGILIALGFGFEFLAARQSVIQIKFSFIVIALIAMLYGPVVSAFSAGIIDIFSGLLSGSIWPELVLVKILAGLIFGIFLYKAKTPYTSSRNISETLKSFFTTKQGYAFMIKATLAKISINVICNIVLTTLVLQMRLGGKTYMARLATAVPKNLIMLPVEILIMIAVLVPVYNIYYTCFKKAIHKAEQ